MSNMTKPKKPYEGYPLTAHPNGHWCKKIKGRIHYFGRWDDPTAALNLYLEQRDDLQAGRSPRTDAAGTTVALALDQFLSSKLLLQESGEISKRSYDDYEATCERIGKSLGLGTSVASVNQSDLEKLRRDLAKGKRGPWSPTTQKGELTRARMFFLYVNEYIVEKQIVYRRILKSPSKRAFRKVANERGPRMFEAAELRTILKAAGPQLKAMVYLGINCGFGNSDCGTLTMDKLDLVKGWHNHWRPKTHNPRSCPLWPETVAAIKAVIGRRTQGLVFQTSKGNPWTNAEEDRDNPLSFEFRKLLQTLEMYRVRVTTFYSIRRTFETIAAPTGEQVAIDYIMGHIAPTNDMASVYRQKTFDAPLLKVTNHVRAWLLGRKKIE
jgi:integrase